MGRISTHKWMLIGLVISGLAQAQNRPRFLVREAPDETPRNDVENPYRLGVFFSSVVPTGKPFNRVGGTIDSNFPFQASTAMGIHGSYFWTSNLEFGMDVGYESFESRFDQSVGSTEFRTANLRNFPIELLARYHMRGQSIRPYFEGGLGVSFQKMNVTSTNVGQATLTDSGMNFQGRAGLGTSIAWGETNELLLGLGYRQVLSSKKSFDAGIFTIDRSSLSGLFAKVELNYLF